MIFKISVLALMLCVGSLKLVSGASFSKVYVSSGQEAVPLEYVRYGAPTVSIPDPQIAQISAAPIGSVVPVASSPNLITTCGTPCIYPGSAISSVAQIASATPNFVTYKSNVPVVVTNNEEPTGYEYSYVVYDDETGDHKAQHELSDGTVVRGAYSLIQPDGYVREVHYTADDLKGFNAVVKKFLPVHVETKDEDKEKQNPAPPCYEIKNENHEESHTEPDTGDKLHETHEENHEIVHHGHGDHPTEEKHDKKSEALTEGPSESNEEEEPSEKNAGDLGSVSVNEEPTHQEEHKTEVQSEHQVKEEPSYRDIVKCVQMAINSKDQVPAPLTYIILNSPC